MIIMVEEQAIPQLSIESAASMVEIAIIAHKLGALAEELKDKLSQINENEIKI